LGLHTQAINERKGEGDMPVKMTIKGYFSSCQGVEKATLTLIILPSQELGA
jgi:hypothetical protein